MASSSNDERKAATKRKAHEIRDEALKGKTFDGGSWVKATELKKGDFLSCNQHYIVDDPDHGGGRVRLKTLEGNNVSNVSNGILENEYFGLQVKESMKVNRTAQMTITLQRCTNQHTHRSRST